MSLTIDLTEGPVTRFTLSGRLDTYTAPELDQSLDKLLASGGIQRLIFDLAALEYLSSAGIRCFVRARKTVEPGGGQVALVNPQPAVRKVLEIVKAMPRGRIFESLAELDDYLDAMQTQASGDDQ